jgi:Spy/CpxP family protein refolding chaperone
MATTTNSKLPWILVSLLVALNVLVLVLVWFKPPPCPPPHPGGGPGGSPRMGLPHELGMNAAETERVRALQQAHFDEMNGYYQQIVALRREAFAHFGTAEADSVAAMAALDKIGTVQIAAEKERYRHFYEILAYCTPEQAVRFQTLLPELLARKRHPENGLPGPPRGPGRPAM